MSAKCTSSLEILYSDEHDPPVTVIREIRVRPGNEPAFESLMHHLIAGAARQPGNLGATVVRPDRQSQDGTYRFVYKFDRRSKLEAWHRSESRARLFAPVESLVESDCFETYPGLETWFELPGVALPPRWKTTLMSWAVIYVLVVAASYALQALRFEAPIPIRVLVLTVIVVPLVAHVFAPWMGRLLHGWLHAETGCAPKRVNE
jgi:antibiotic biosynthesis monooxygenase (ABM) superfamily enzyme